MAPAPSFPLLHSLAQHCLCDGIGFYQLYELQSPSGSPHLNCALSFRRLFNADPAEAEVIYEAARELVASESRARKGRTV